MQPFTKDWFVKHREIDTSADYNAVLNALRQLTTAPLELDGPGDDAYFLADIRVGRLSDECSALITFSAYGNLCYIKSTPTPMNEIVAIKKAIEDNGWIIVPDEAVWLPFDEKGLESVYDVFFEYV